MRPPSAKPTNKLKTKADDKKEYLIFLWTQTQNPLPAVRI